MPRAAVGKRRGEYGIVLTARQRTLRIAPYVLAAALYLSIASWTTFRTTALDYGAYLIGAHGFITGQDVYAWSALDFQAEARDLNIPYYAYPYRYAPVMALLLSPLLLLPYRGGLFLWSVINAAAVIAAGELLSRLSPLPAKRWGIRVAVWLFTPFFVSLYAGQVNPLITLLGAFAVTAIHNGRDRAAGVWAAFAFLIKPVAVGLLCYPVWKGRWKTAVTIAIITVVVLGLMTALFGWGSLRSGVPLAASGIHVGPYPPHQNLWGLALRWFTAHEYGWSAAANPEIAEKAGLLLSLGLAIATLMLCLPPMRRNSWRDADWGLVLVAIALVATGTWYHHYALLAIPLAIAIARAETFAELALSLFSWLAMNLFGAWHFMIGFTPLLDLGTFGAFALWVALAGISLRQRKRLPVPERAGIN